MDGYEVAIWCCAITMTGGFIMLAWLMVLDEIRHRRARWQAAQKMAGYGSLILTREEFFDAMPHWRFYFGPDPRSPFHRRVLHFSIGKNRTADDGEICYRFWLEARMARGWTYRHLVGPFVDSAAWTGRELIPPCEIYRPEAPRTLEVWWGFIR